MVTTKIVDLPSGNQSLFANRLLNHLRRIFCEDIVINTLEDDNRDDPYQFIDIFRKNDKILGVHLFGMRVSNDSPIIVTSYTVSDRTGHLFTEVLNHEIVMSDEMVDDLIISTLKKVATINQSHFKWFIERYNEAFTLREPTLVFIGEFINGFEKLNSGQ